MFYLFVILVKIDKTSMMVCVDEELEVCVFHCLYVLWVNFDCTYVIRGSCLFTIIGEITSSNTPCLVDLLVTRRLIHCCF